MASIMIGVAGVAQQLKSASAVSAPSGARILNYDPTSGSGNNSAVHIGERESFSNPFDYTGAFNDTLSSLPAHELTAEAEVLEIAYTGNAAVATIEFGGYCQVTDATGCSFAWDVSIEDESLSLGNSAAIIGTASTAQNSIAMGAGTGDGVGEKLQITWGGNKSGFVMPADGDYVEVSISCTVTNSAGSDNDELRYKVTFAE